MSSNIPPFLKKDGDSLLFNQDGEFIFFVPEIYFERKYAESLGEYTRLFGILDYTIVDKSGKQGKMMPFNFPTVFLCSPSVIEKRKQIKLSPKSKPQDYRALIFRKGDKIVVSTKVPQIISNCEDFFSMFFTGKLPTTIPYDKLHDYFIDNIHLNGGDYGLNIQLFGILVSEICRDPNDRKKLFRHTDMNDMTNYQPIGIKEIPKYISPFTAITSENIDESLVNGILNKSAKYSPLEKLMV